MAVSSLEPSYISFTSLKSYGYLPTQETDEETLQTNLVKITDIDTDESVLIFVSHRGIYQSDECRASVDTQHHDKYKLLCESVEKLMTLLIPGAKECYLWMDCICINENNGTESTSLPPLDVIMENCDLILTPMFDPSVSDTIHNAEDPYEARPWGYGPEAYLGRAWCRLEMLYSLSLPLKNACEKKRQTYHESFQFVLDRESRARPHLLYGSFEAKIDLPPLILPEQDIMFFNEYHPYKGKYSRHEDRILVISQMDRLQELLITKGDEYYKPFKSIFEFGNNPLDRPNTADSTSSTSVDGLSEEVVRLPDGSMYRGPWKAGKKHGKGTLQKVNGDIYDGYFENDEFHGMGVLWYKNGDRYEGNFEYGYHQGHGIYVYNDGDMYDGDFVQGVREGHGTLQFFDGSYYTGNFECDSVQGKGKLVNTDGGTYEGDFVNGIFEGEGTFKGSDGATYVGQYKDGIMNGKGLYRFKNGDTYEGNFKDGMFHGKGVYKSIYGDVYEGHYRNDKRHGKGKLRTAMGSTFVGRWEHGQRTQKCTIS